MTDQPREPELSYLMPDGYELTWVRRGRGGRWRCQLSDGWVESSSADACAVAAIRDVERAASPTDQPEKRTATMAEVVESLAQSYTDDGVAIYLASRNRLLDGERPIDVCKTAEGRYRVWCAAEAAADGVFV